MSDDNEKVWEAISDQVMLVSDVALLREQP